MTLATMNWEKGVTCIYNNMSKLQDFCYNSTIQAAENINHVGVNHDVGLTFNSLVGFFKLYILSPDLCFERNSPPYTSYSNPLLHRD